MKMVDFKSKLSEIFVNIGVNNYAGVVVMGTNDLAYHDRVKQRFHHLAEYLMKKNYLIIWAMAKGFSLDYTNDIKIVKHNLIMCNFYDRSIFNTVIDFLPTHFKKLIYWLTVTDAYTSVDDVIKLKSLGYKILYDYIDEISPEIYSGITQTTLDRHDYILRDYDIVIACTSDIIYSKAIKYRRNNVVLSKNGVSIEDWNIDNDFIPEEMKKILNSKRPIIGFYGAFGPWIAYDYITYLASKRKNYEIVMIGYDYDFGSGAFAKSNLHTLSNVHIIGAQPYSHLKYYSQFFSVAIIPFNLSEVAQSVNPVKLFEYAAQKIPVVTTRMHECALYDICLISDTKDDFINNIDRAITLRENRDYSQRLLDIAKDNTWENRFNILYDFLDKSECINRTPVLSIIVPSYNIEKYVDKILHNVYLKTIIDDIEIIFINDGSTDETLKVLVAAQKALFPKIKIIDKENGGHGSCINRGIKEAKGTYVKIIDGDDYVDPLALIKHIVYLKNSDVDLVVTNYDRVCDDGTTLEVNYNDRLAERDYNAKDFINALNIDQSSFSYVHFAAITCKLDILKKIKPITEKSYYVDCEYDAYIFSFIQKVHFQKIRLYQYYIGRPDQSVNPAVAKSRAKENLNIINSITKYYEKENLDYAKRNALAVLFNQTYFYITYGEEIEIKKLLKWWSDKLDNYLNILRNHYEEIYCSRVENDPAIDLNSTKKSKNSKKTKEFCHYLIRVLKFFPLCAIKFFKAVKHSGIKTAMNITLCKLKKGVIAISHPFKYYKMSKSLTHQLASERESKLIIQNEFTGEIRKLQKSLSDQKKYILNINAEIGTLSHKVRQSDNFIDKLKQEKNLLNNELNHAETQIENLNKNLLNEKIKSIEYIHPKACLGDNFENHDKTKKQVLIIGYYGVNNYGDEAMLKSVLANKDSGKEYSVMFQYGDYRYNFSRWPNCHHYYPPKSIDSIDIIVSFFDEIIVGGGAHLDDIEMIEDLSYIPYIITELSLKFIEHQKAVKWIGLSSIKELKSEIFINKLKFIAANCSEFSVRDVYTYELLKTKLGVASERIKLVDDIALKLKDKKIIAVNLINTLGDDNKNILLLKELISFVKNNGNKYRICFVTFYNFHHYDTLMYEKYISEIDFGEVEYFITNEYKTVDDLYPIFAGCDLFINMRYHASLFSLSYGKPTISICYDIHRHYYNKMKYINEKYQNKNLIYYSTYCDGQLLSILNSLKTEK